MKELSIEEKAKRYDEAIKKAKSKIKDDKDHVLYEDDVIEIFPELKESREDEMIRVIKEVILNSVPYKINILTKDTTITAEEAIAWLEKQGEQKSQRMVSAEAKEAMYDKPAWSEEDEDILNTIINHFKVDIECTDEDDTVRWLKSLKDRVQPKQEWSEEDEVMLDSIIEEVRYMGDFPDYPTKEENELYDKCLAKVDWLKSLRPHSQWKPSDEQMEELAGAIVFLKEHGFEATILVGLLKDLKKM